jgi:hypothetical protein
MQQTESQNHSFNVTSWCVVDVALKIRCWDVYWGVRAQTYSTRTILPWFLSPSWVSTTGTCHILNVDSERTWNNQFGLQHHAQRRSSPRISQSGLHLWVLKNKFMPFLPWSVLPNCPVSLLWMAGSVSSKHIGEECVRTPWRSHTKISRWEYT